MLLEEIYETSPAVRLISLLNVGAEINYALPEVSNMINGVKYYSVEITMNEDIYYIQAYNTEAIELYTVILSFFSDKIGGNQN